MQNSKWNYIAAGFSVCGTLLMAVAHNGFQTLIFVGLTIWNWVTAEALRHKEEFELIEQYKQSLNTEEKETGEESEND